MSASTQSIPSNVLEEMPARVRDWHLFTRLIAILMPYWAAVLISLLSALATMALQILNPLILSVAIDRYFLHHEPEASLSGFTLPLDPAHGVLLLSCLFFAVLVLTLICETAQAFLVQWTGQRAMADLRRRLLIQLQSLPLSFYDVTPAGRLVTRVTTDVEALSDLFSNGLISILANILMTAFFLAVLFRLNAPLSCALAAVLPAFVALTVYFRRIITPSQQRVRILIARINTFVAEHISGISIVQLFNRQQVSLAQFDRINAEHMAASKQWVQGNAWFLPTTEFLGTFSQAGLLFAGGFLLHRHQLTVGTLVAFLQYGTRFLKPIQEISERYGILQSSLVSAQKVFDLLDTPAAHRLAGQVLSPPAPTSLEFDRVWFAYKNGRWVLRNLSFRAEPGQMLAIVGHTGAGKTTLTNLLLRFYEPQQGTISLGHTSIREMDLASLRRQFGVVLQESYMREGTILDNIRFGSDEMPDAVAQAAAHQVGLTDAICHLDGGLLAHVQERGENLSSGQKQLIAFARALAHNPSFLILDEATSNVDLETEAKIQKALSRLLVGRTSLVIAHRLSTIINANRIIVMHRGEVAEVGNHTQLLAKRGLYWKLCQLQFGLHASDATPILNLESQ